jgi:hypothetical protein
MAFPLSKSVEPGAGQTLKYAPVFPEGQLGLLTFDGDAGGDTRPHRQTVSSPGQGRYGITFSRGDMCIPVCVPRSKIPIALSGHNRARPPKIDFSLDS